MHGRVAGYVELLRDRFKSLMNDEVFDICSYFTRGNFDDKILSFFIFVKIDGFLATLTYLRFFPKFSSEMLGFNRLGSWNC